jgi:hypothetical protein
MDQAQIHQLVETSHYDANTATKLESYLQQQLSNKTYDFVANKALMSYYQVNPSNIKVETICNILILSLMRLPNNDFLSLLYMLPPKVINHSKITIVQECASCLEKGRYTDFWEEYISAPDNMFGAANGFVDFIRRYILGILRDTYTDIPSSLFAQQLGLNESSVEAFCNGNKFIEKVTCTSFFLTFLFIFLNRLLEVMWFLLEMKKTNQRHLHQKLPFILTK